jgi:site-specific DNA recombinase
MSKRVFLYARVASKPQVGRSVQLEGQLTAMRRYARARKWQIAGEYVDEGRSYRRHRPGFEQMMKDAGSGNCDAILVECRTRLSRDHFDLELYTRRLAQKNVTIHSLSEFWGGQPEAIAEQLAIFLLRYEEPARFREQQIASASREKVQIGEK